MIRAKHRWVGCLVALAFLGGWCESRAFGDDASSEADGFLVGYLEAFNSGDADALGAYWAEDATSVSGQTGDRKVGRDAIVADYRDLFEQSPGARLSGGVDHSRKLGADLALIEGRVTLFVPDAEPQESAFTAVIRRGERGWLIESATEHAAPSPPSPYEALRPLAWLVGEWRDDVDGVAVQTTVRWSPSKAFLLRSFNADYGDGDAFEGTQVIGWDPSAARLRTWVFHSDGSFGEGAVSISGADSVFRMSHVRADGSVSATTQVITRVDDDTLRVQAIGRTIDGAPAPAGDPVTVVRVSGPAAETTAGADR